MGSSWTNITVTQARGQRRLQIDRTLSSSLSTEGDFSIIGNELTKSYSQVEVSVHTCVCVI